MKKNLIVIISVYFLNTAFAFEDLREDFSYNNSPTNDSNVAGDHEQCPCMANISSNVDKIMAQTAKQPSENGTDAVVK